MKRDKDAWGDLLELVDSPSPRRPHAPLEPWPAQEVHVPICAHPLVDPPHPLVTNSSSEQSVRTLDVAQLDQGPWDNSIMQQVTRW